jgi:hypothetical protein
MPEVRVFADTYVVLEAFRTRCRTAITTPFTVEKVEQGVEETLTVRQGRCGKRPGPGETCRLSA